jgi:hypothetical protein
LSTAHAVLELTVVATAVGQRHRTRSAVQPIAPLAVVTTTIRRLLDAAALRMAVDEVAGVAAAVLPHETTDAGVREIRERDSDRATVRHRQHADVFVLRRLVGNGETDRQCRDDRDAAREELWEP